MRLVAACIFTPLINRARRAFTFIVSPACNCPRLWHSQIHLGTVFCGRYGVWKNLLRKKGAGTIMSFSDQRREDMTMKIIAVVGATGAQGGGLVRAIQNDPQ